ncbi:flagellar assembly protein FliH [Gottschalkia purinilytica]|uniref:Flagellar assembly protein FliH n=1 Tax=Gottschalkia purinilytica TaxID=1503 RepID=A0A0L0WBJ5_GOTPU|nr:FliH/SctL family protein [Gottschalkia purinilytica]KNF08812.1 flagellar assembly protein FliH [Gottschalkia purinilytica]
MSSIIKSSQIVEIKDRTNVYKEARNIIDDTRKQQDDILNKAKEEAKRIIEQTIEKANNESEKILHNANEEAEKIKKKAKETGYEEGHQEGYDKGYNKGHDDGKKEGYEIGYGEGKEITDKLIEEANEIKKNYLQERDHILKSIEPDVIDLVIQTCEKIINKELDEKETIIDVIIKGINSLNSKDSLVIRVSKEDFNTAFESRQQILAKASLIEDVDIKLDANLIKGDCIIESSQGNADVSVGLQVEEMKKMIKGLLNGE